MPPTKFGEGKYDGRTSEVTDATDSVKAGEAKEAERGGALRREIESERQSDEAPPPL
jgi:hypothetical protein